jgi:hypothetical protein
MNVVDRTLVPDYFPIAPTREPKSDIETSAPTPSGADVLISVLNAKVYIESTVVIDPPSDGGGVDHPWDKSGTNVNVLSLHKLKERHDFSRERDE